MYSSIALKSGRYVQTIIMYVSDCIRGHLNFRPSEVHATSQQAVAVQPASHHRPSFSTSPTTTQKPASFDATRLIHQHSPPRPPPPPLPTAGSLASVSTTTPGGYMIGSLSNPLVGTMRPTGPRTTPAQKATTLPSSLLADADYMHRFRFFLYTANFCYI